eukprot:jgi/Galph1/5227/GphlegSOOS_G3847.1
MTKKKVAQRAATTKDKEKIVTRGVKNIAKRDNKRQVKEQVASSDILKKEESKEPLNILKKIQVPRHGDSMKTFVSWNVAGLRSTVKNSLFMDFLCHLDADVLCLQETKLTDDNQVAQLTEALKTKYKDIWNHCTARKGYSGTAVFTKDVPSVVSFGLQGEKHNSEGRVITLELDKYFLVNAYVPNAGEGLRRLEYRIDNWEKDMREYLCALDQKKPVVLTGDLNVAHQEIDIYQPKGHEKHAGFTPQERQNFTELLNCGFVDAFRYLYPTRQAFSYWSKRAKAKERNHGWRLDYFVISQRLVPCLVQCEMFDEVYISDHCPIMLQLDWSKLPTE